MRPKCMLWTAPSLLHTVSRRPVSALLMRENRSHNDVSAAVVFMQHNALTTAIHIAFADAGLFHFEFLQTICMCTCVWKCEDVCPLRGAWVTERFIPSACLSKRCCGQGHLRWQWMGCGRGSGIKGLLARTESGSFSLWQREVTGRQRTGDRRTASQRHLHSFRTAAYPCTKKHALSKRPPSTLSHSVLHTHAHACTRKRVWGHTCNTQTHKTLVPRSTFPRVHTVCTHKRQNGKSSNYSWTTVARPKNQKSKCRFDFFVVFAVL